MTLKKYQAKRKFSETSEPRGKIARSGKNSFVVQEHWASHHHFDFRLEIEGVLKSWAVPKGLPEKKGIKRLAVQVEDHPVDYINFEGKIPKGLYGAGTVKIYDKGKYELIDKTKDKISFTLKDKKLKGEYHLIKTKLGKNQWLLIRTK
jgi:bifunctional non-homologous end joining protein LigD